MRVLVVDDEQRITSNIKDYLVSDGHTVDTAANGEDALVLADINSYDLVILDWMLPDMDGPKICKVLRENKIDSPVLMLTAKSQLEDKVEGLNAGADDYLTKPFEFDELDARIRALLRRKIGGSSTPLIRIADFTLDTNTREVTRGGQKVDLAPREFSLLEYLVLNRGKALGRTDILEHVWGESVDQFSNTVDVHIRYLRKKIDDDFDTKLIKTVKGKGYMLCLE